jgi:hypothetical protein
MADSALLEKLLSRLGPLRERAATARRLAGDVSDDDHARQSMLAYAAELDTQEQEVAAQLALLRQQAAEAAAETEEPTAALKPPPT